MNALAIFLKLAVVLVTIPFFVLLGGFLVYLTGHQAFVLVTETPEEFHQRMVSEITPEIISSQPEIGVIQKIYDLDLPLTFCVVEFEGAWLASAILTQPAGVGEEVELQVVQVRSSSAGAISYIFVASPVLKPEQEEEG